jgi:acyl-coenzyme A synthetase/AMP-(fatty) acid ligase
MNFHNILVVYFSLCQVEFDESLPKTVSGKIRRIQLRIDEWNK